MPAPTPVGSPVIATSGAANVSTMDTALPGAAAAGDLAVLLLRTVPGAAVLTGPGGTEHHNADLGNARLGLWSKVLDGADITAGKLTVTRATSAAYASVLKVWRGAAVDQVSATGSSGTISTTATLPAITPGVADALRVGVIACRTDATGVSTTFTHPGGWTEVGDISDTVAGRRGTAWFGEIQLTGQNGVPQGTVAVTASGAGMTWGALSLTITGTAATVSGTLAGSSTADGVLAAMVRRAGQLAGSATSTGVLAGRVVRTGALSGPAGSTGALAGTVRRGGTLAGSVVASGTLAGTVTAGGTTVAGTLAGSSAASGTLAGRVRRSGALAGSSAAAGTLAGRPRHAGELAASAGATGVLGGTVRRYGALAGDVIAAGTLAGTVRGPFTVGVLVGSTSSASLTGSTSSTTLTATSRKAGPT